MSVHVGCRFVRTGAVCAAALLAVAVPSAVEAQSAAATTESRPTPPLRPGLFPEPAAITKGMDLANRRMDTEDEGDSDGFYLETGNMVTGAGWIAAGPGYKRRLIGGRVIFDASAAVSWRLYKMAQANLEFPLRDEQVIVGTQLRWQDLTQISYFGDGPDAPLAARSEYGLRSTNAAAYASVRPLAWFSLDAKAGIIGRPSIKSPSGTFERGNPFTREMFPADPVFAVVEQPRYTYGELSASADTRNAPGYPTSGGLYRTAWSRYSDRDTGAFSFRRFEIEAARFVELPVARTVLAAHGWLLTTQTSPGQHVPFYLLPALGGNNTIRGYTDYRFHDRNLVLMSVEARVPMFTHVDGAVFADAGNVAARAGDLDLGRRSYGFGLRLHSARSTFARLDIARSDEGWQIVFRLNDPIRLSRLARRSAPVPFAP